MIWLAFVLCALTIIYSGTKLSKYGDVIAEKTGLGGSLIGLILIASVTSLPELITGVSAITVFNVPDIAVGDIFGSCVFNLFILAAMLDAIHKPLPISTKAHHGHILSAACGLLLLSLAVFGMVFPEYNKPVKWLGSISILIAVVYFSAIKLISSYEKKQLEAHLHDVSDSLKYREVSLRDAALKYSVNAIVVIIAAAFLPMLGERMALATGLGETFVGNVFIALASSLPEVVVSVAAVRMGSVDMAIGNIFGSNIFNLFILFIDDLLFWQGPLLSRVSSTHNIAALAAILMTAISIMGLTYRADKKDLPWGWDSILMMIVFVFNIALMYYRI